MFIGNIDGNSIKSKENIGGNKNEQGIFHAK